MDGPERAFIEDLARELDGWLRIASDSLSDQTTDLTWAGAAASSVSRLRGTVTREFISDYEAVLRQILAGLLHSVLVSIDGGTQLADEVRLELRTLDGKVLKSGLNELLMDYLIETNRVPSEGRSA